MKHLKIDKPRLITIVFVFLILLGVFLRFYRIGEWQYFHFDQARDYLIAYRIFNEHKFTLVGPTVLIPGVYLPPFYYYSLIPFLALSKWLPIGGDIYTALLGTLSIGLFYLLIKNVNRYSALFLTFCYSLNPYLIQTSRHAWNPNTTNFWMLAFVLCAISFLQSKKYYLIIAGAILGLSLSFHYPLLFLTPVLFGLVFIAVKKRHVGSAILSIALFGLFVSPLVFFDLRHGWSNTRAIVTFLSGTDNLGVDIPSKISGFIDTVIKLPPVFLGGLNQQQNLSIDPNAIANWSLIRPESLIWLPYFLLFWVGVYIWIKTANQPTKKLTLICLVLSSLIPIIFPAKSLYFYHFQFILPLLFIPIGFVWNRVNLVIKTGVIVLMLLPIFSLRLSQTVKNSSYFQQPVSLIVDDYRQSPVDTINIIANLTDHWQHHAPEYRYFMTINRLPVLSDMPNDYSLADRVYLIDEGDLVNPFELQGAEMNAFNPRATKREWITSFNQNIYRLEK